MTEAEIQSITRADASPAATLAEAMLTLNNTHAQELSWLEPSGWRI
jgi:predicted GNAT superfamily acetyltransferase